MVAMPALGGVYPVLAGAEAPGAAAAPFALAALTVALMWWDARRRQAGPIFSLLVGAVALFVVAFPLYMRRRIHWGAPSKLPHALCSVAILVLGQVYAGATPTRASASVRCIRIEGAAFTSIDCKVKQTSGSASAATCFTVTTSCGGVEEWRDRACVDTEPGGQTVTHHFPPDTSACARPIVEASEITTTAR